MKAVVFRGVGDIRIEDVPEPKIEQPTDAIVRLTSSAICGTDLHFVRGTASGVKPGTILGHEGVGIVEKVGAMVRNLEVGDRVVIPSTIACGSCSYCRAGYFAQCDNANPGGKQAGTAFFGGPAENGGFPGMQAEKVRVPFANVGLVKLPDEVSDDQAILLSDIFPTGYFAAEMAEIEPGDTVAVFGCGPVGQFAIASAYLLGAERVIAIDRFDYRLTMAREKAGAETINYEQTSVREALREMTGGRGPDACIDCVGLEAHHPHPGMYAYDRVKQATRMETERGYALREAIFNCRSGGTVSIMGVYGGFMDKFPIGAVMNRGLTIKTGQCHVHRYLKPLLKHIEQGDIDPSFIVTHRMSLDDASDGYETFKHKQDECVKVVLKP